MYHSLCKYLCTIFTILLFAMFVPSMVEAATLQSEYLTFAENEDGTLTVIAYDRSKHESPYNLEVNSLYSIDDKSYQVTNIGDGVFKGYTFHSIHVGMGISIGNHSFENITVNNYQNSFNEYETVGIVGHDTTNSNVTIGDYAFANATFHSQVSFGNFSSVGHYAFYNAQFEYPDWTIFRSISHIGDYCFYNANLSYIVSDTQYICSIGDYAFYNTYFTSYTIYPSLQSLGSHAFQEDYNMTFTIRSDVTDISHLAFEPDWLKNTYFLVHINSPIIPYLESIRVCYTIIETNETVQPRARIGSIIDYDLSGNYLMDATDSSHSDYISFQVTGNASVDMVRAKTSGFTVNLTNSYNYNERYSYTIHAITSGAFQSEQCPNLTTISLNETTITSIQTGAFTTCNTLETVTLPKTLKTIEENAFPNSANLHIVIPYEITDISNYNIDDLTNVVFVIDKNSPLASTLSKRKLTYQLGSNGKVVYPRPQKGTSFIQGKLQYKVTGKSTVTFMKPSSKNLTKITIPASVSHKGYTFKVTKINAKACYKYKKLKTVVIGNNVTQVGDSAFANCSKLKSITFGKKVKKLGKKVLYYDKKLTTIKFTGTKLQSIGKQTFRKVPKKVNIIVPTSKVKKYSGLIKKAT